MTSLGVLVVRIAMLSSAVHEMPLSGENWKPVSWCMLEITGFIAVLM